MVSRKRKATNSMSRPVMIDQDLYHRRHGTVTQIIRELIRRNWHKQLTNLIEGSIDVAIVKEFYENLYDPEDKSPKQVRVRGHLIKFGADSLNAILETPMVLEKEESIPA
ncbi:hypothetical protein GmHk_03G007067 [Glycine max]|nr:hypothetical protein GmHk_03G007067 [Glycine max]